MTYNRRIHLLYPEDRWVPAQWIINQFADQVADGNISAEYFNVKSLREMAMALEDIGVITTATDSEWGHE